ncbi:MAG: ribosomal L7Ae/L30e/S12e/Gadd45 family protein [Bacillota bacterium]
MQTIKDTKEKVIGLKQTLRAIQQGTISKVYIANDVEDHVLRKITGPCQEKGIAIIQSNLTQRELGRLCQIEVGAAVVGIISNQ